MSNLTEELQGIHRRLSYYFEGVAREIWPRRFFEMRRDGLLHQVLQRRDADILIGRANYYNRLAPGLAVSPSTPIDRIDRSRSRYFLDLCRYLRFFSPGLKVDYRFGDVVDVPASPELLKSRPVAGENANSVLLNLDKLRHYRLYTDARSWGDKLPKAIWRGRLNNPLRNDLIRGHCASGLCDVGHIGEPLDGVMPKAFLSPSQQLAYRYVISVEGIDVATNLKWIMASNSLCLMPRSRYETWFMEGALVPGYHFIEIRDDFSDLEEKIEQLEKDPAMARDIIRNANAFVADFFDPVREKLVSLLVLQKYFEATGQLPPSEFTSAFFGSQAATAPVLLTA